MRGEESQDTVIFSVWFVEFKSEFITMKMPNLQWSLIQFFIFSNSVLMWRQAKIVMNVLRGPSFTDICLKLYLPPEQVPPAAPVDGPLAGHILKLDLCRL